MAHAKKERMLYKPSKHAQCLDCVLLSAYEEKGEGEGNCLPSHQEEGGNNSWGGS